MTTWVMFIILLGYVLLWFVGAGIITIIIFLALSKIKDRLDKLER